NEYFFLRNNNTADRAVVLKRDPQNEEAMYPLKVILAGCDRRVTSLVHDELTHQAIDIEDEYPAIGDLLARRDEFREGPRLLLTHLRQEEDFIEAKRLSRAFAGWPLVSFVDEGADATVLLAAMRAGSSQVVPMPLDGQDFQEALDCVGVHFGRSPRASR